MTTSLFAVSVGPLDSVPAPFVLNEAMWISIWVGLVREHGVPELRVPAGQCVRVTIDVVDEAQAPPRVPETRALRLVSRTLAPAARLSAKQQ
jgi:hypothetical protein